MKKGDIIKCHNPDEMIELMLELAKKGIESDFMYKKDGEKGLWLVITRVGRRSNGNKTSRNMGKQYICLMSLRRQRWSLIRFGVLLLPR